MGKEEERTLWNAAASLLYANASLAFVGVLHPLGHSGVMPEDEHEKEAA